ncbi:MFS transporter [Pseudoneobacillus sp. C159]
MSRSKYNVVLIFIITIFQSLIFAYVIERVFAESRNLSVLDMQYLLILYSVFSIIFEIPAGVVADFWKKKYTLALGLAFCWFEFFISIFSYSFPMFSLVYFAAALGGSLRSGTMEAILYQTLKEDSQESDYVKVTGQLKFVKYLVAGAVAIIGGYIADQYGYEMNYWLSLIGYPVAIIFILCLHEPNIGPFNLKETKATSLFMHMKAGLNLTWKNHHLRNVILISGIVGAVLYGQLHEMSMLLYPDLGISVKYFGIVSIGIMVTAAFSGFLTERLKQMMKNPYQNLLVFLVPSISIFLFGSVDGWWGVLFLMLAIGLLEAITVVYSGYLQDDAPDELRVTISSVSSFVHNGLSIGIGLLFGYFAQWFNIHISFQMLAFVLGGIVILQPVFSLRKRLIGKGVNPN